MACERWSQKTGSERGWSEKLDTYVDGELPASEERDVREHLRTCASCAADALDRMQVKRSIQAAGQRFRPRRARPAARGVAPPVAGVAA